MTCYVIIPGRACNWLEIQEMERRVKGRRAVKDTCRYTQVREEDGVR